MGRRTNTAVWLEKYNRWQINVQKDGVRRTFTSSKPGRAGQREANKKADDWIDNNIQLTNQRVNQIYPKYLDSIISKEENRKASSLGNCYILPALGTKRITSLTEGNFQQILDKAAVKGFNGKPLSRKTLTSLYCTMKNFMKFCRRNKLCVETLEFLEVPKIAKKKEKRILQPDDLVTLFTVDITYMHGKLIKDSYIHAYRFAVLTGLRPGELIGLERGDINGRVIRMQRSINIHGEETAGKNDNAKRQIVITAQAEKELLEQLSECDEKRVFGIQSESTYRHRWQRYCETNHIPYVSPYELRHTFVSMTKGLSDGEIKTIVGHSKNMDTWGVYGHDVIGEKEKIANKLEAIFEELLFVK